MGTLPHFSAISKKGNNFCDFMLSSLEKHVFFLMESTLTGMNLLLGSKFFPVRVDTF